MNLIKVDNPTPYIEKQTNYEHSWLVGNNKELLG